MGNWLGKIRQLVRGYSVREAYNRGDHSTITLFEQVMIKLVPKISGDGVEVIPKQVTKTI
jgi:hypothetical protein